MKQENISISILNAEDKNMVLDNLYKANKKINEIKVLDKFNNIIHFDIMDNKFVKNVGVELEYIKTAKKYGFVADVHLMVKRPLEDGYIDRAIDYGADLITIHYEIDNFEKVLKYLNDKNIRAGVAIKPNTDIKDIQKYKNKIDTVLIMTVEPGYGGQKYIDEVNEKIKIASKIFSDKNIEIDGGVNEDTIRFGIENDVSTFVIGTSIIKSKNYYNTLVKYNIIRQLEKFNKKADKKFDENTLMIKDGGYGYGDILLGICVPDTRKCSKVWYKYVTYDTIEFFLKSKYHEYRRLATFLMSNISKDNKENIKVLKDVNNIIESNIQFINNWDLTDEVGPNILGYYLMLLDKTNRDKVLNRYLSSNKIWEKRIGIVSLLRFARNGQNDFCLKKINLVLYEDFHLFQKASGWVLREVYKNCNDLVIKYLYTNNKKKKLPSILLSYATEKMNKQQKDYIKNIENISFKC